MAAHYDEAVEIISSMDSEMKTKKNTSKTAFMAFALLLAVQFGASAQDSYVDSLWNAANAAYVDGRWADAVADYELISGMGLESASLYCNTLDAYF